MSDTDDLDNQYKDVLRGIISRRSIYLASIFDLHRDTVDLVLIRDKGIRGTQRPGKIRVNIEDSESLVDVYDHILTIFHEIGHALDKKSQYFFGAERRARRFEYKVAHKLGGVFPKLISDMTRAAGEENWNKFGEMFHNDTFYKQQVSKRIKNDNHYAAAQREFYAHAA